MGGGCASPHFPEWELLRSTQPIRARRCCVVARPAYFCKSAHRPRFPWPPLRVSIVVSAEDPKQIGSWCTARHKKRKKTFLSSGGLQLQWHEGEGPEGFRGRGGAGAPKGCPRIGETPCEDAPTAANGYGRNGRMNLSAPRVQTLNTAPHFGRCSVDQLYNSSRMCSKTTISPFTCRTGCHRLLPF